MRVVCNMASGLVLNAPRANGREDVALAFGVNEIDDEFGATWFAMNAASPLVADGKLAQLSPDGPDPEVVADPAPEPTQEG